MKTINKIFLFVLTVGLVSCAGQRTYDFHPGFIDVHQTNLYNNKLDLLWVIDNSKSMQKHQINLKRQLIHLIDLLHAKKVDYRIGVTTMDVGFGGEKGRFIGRPSVLHSGVPNVRFRFLDSVLIGEGGSEIERGLEAMERALSKGRLEGENAGFFRRDAFLAVVFVSNENDQSDNTVEYYANFLNRLKGSREGGHGGSASWMSHYIGIISPYGYCTTRGSYSSTGDRYMKLAALSGGYSGSICGGNLFVALGRIRDSLLKRVTSFNLKAWPVMGTVRVFVNDIEIPEDRNNGWSYENRLNRIIFHGSGIPREGSVIRVNYKPLHDNKHDRRKSYGQNRSHRQGGIPHRSYNNGEPYNQGQFHSNKGPGVNNRGQQQSNRSQVNTKQESRMGKPKPYDRTSYSVRKSVQRDQQSRRSSRDQSYY